jgi:4-hydroxy-4-methyl-2-oxoglutarate aldolase
VELPELISRFRNVPVTVLSDVLTRAGAPHQVLSHKIQAVGSPRFAGPAFCVKGGKPTPDAKDLKFDVLRHSGPSIVVISTNVENPPVVMGENIVIALKVRGCLGIVTDGGLRDKDAISVIGIPVYTSFFAPIAPRDWRMIAIDVPVTLPGQSSASVTIFPDDIIVGDDDGVIVVPGASAVTVLEDAEVVVSVEEQIRQRLLAGDDPESAYSLDRFSHIRPLNKATHAAA